MTRQKYAGEEAIREKINDLFTYRKLTDLLQRSGLDKHRTFVRQLGDIQYAIYLLDASLESRWDLDPTELSKLWDGIHKALSKLDLSETEQKKLVREIEIYEQIELDCRKDKWPTRVPFKMFYTIKSCDVRLIRHLIYRAYPALDDIYHEKAWAYYDRITEINDDITDLAEDLQTYNGNRFLISILRKGQFQTWDQYDTYLRKVTKKAKSYFKQRLDRGENKQLYSWTLARSEETRTLLRDTLRDLDLSLLGSSWLLDRMQ